MGSLGGHQFSGHHSWSSLSTQTCLLFVAVGCNRYAVRAVEGTGGQSGIQEGRFTALELYGMGMHSTRRQVLRHTRRQPGSDRHTPVLLCIRPGIRNGQTSNPRYPRSPRSKDCRRHVTLCSVTVQPQCSSSRAWTMMRDRGRAMS